MSAIESGAGGTKAARCLSFLYSPRSWHPFPSPIPARFPKPCPTKTIIADEDLFRVSPFVGDNSAQWHRASSVWYAREVTTPVLILSDVGDNRDPFATSSMYWGALRDNGKNATLRVWPIAGHFPDDPVRTADVFHYWIDFMAQHLR